MRINVGNVLLFLVLMSINYLVVVYYVPSGVQDWVKISIWILLVCVCLIGVRVWRGTAISNKIGECFRGRIADLKAQRKFKKEYRQVKSCLGKHLHGVVKDVRYDPAYVFLVAPDDITKQGILFSLGVDPTDESDCRLIAGSQCWWYVAGMVVYVSEHGSRKGESDLHLTDVASMFDRLIPNKCNYVIIAGIRQSGGEVLSRQLDAMRSSVESVSFSSRRDRLSVLVFVQSNSMEIKYESDSDDQCMDKSIFVHYSDMVENPTEVRLDIQRYLLRKHILEDASRISVDGTSYLSNTVQITNDISCILSWFEETRIGHLEGVFYGGGLARGKKPLRASVLKPIVERVAQANVPLRSSLLAHIRAAVSESTVVTSSLVATLIIAAICLKDYLHIGKLYEESVHASNNVERENDEFRFHLARMERIHELREATARHLGLLLLPKALSGTAELDRVVSLRTKNAYHDLNRALLAKFTLSPRDASRVSRIKVDGLEGLGLVVGQMLSLFNEKVNDLFERSLGVLSKNEIIEGDDAEALRYGMERMIGYLDADERRELIGELRLVAMESMGGSVQNPSNKRSLEGLAEARIPILYSDVWGRLAEPGAVLVSGAYTYDTWIEIKRALEAMAEMSKEFGSHSVNKELNGYERRYLSAWKHTMQLVFDERIVDRMASNEVGDLDSAGFSAFKRYRDYFLSHVARVIPPMPVGWLDKSHLFFKYSLKDEQERVLRSDDAGAGILNRVGRLLTLESSVDTEVLKKYVTVTKRYLDSLEYLSKSSAVLGQTVKVASSLYADEFPARFDNKDTSVLNALVDLKSVYAHEQQDVQPLFQMLEGATCIMVGAALRRAELGVQDAWFAVHRSQEKYDGLSKIEYLFGEEGAVWDFLNDNVQPFVLRRNGRIVAKKVCGKSLRFSPVVYSLLELGKVPESSFISDYSVDINAKPTSVNHGASVHVEEMSVVMVCGEVEQYYRNSNYEKNGRLTWNASKCTDVEIGLSVEGKVLKKRYMGDDAMLSFLDDYGDGKETYTTSDLHKFKGFMDAKGLTEINVHINLKVPGELKKLVELKRLHLAERIVGGVKRDVSRMPRERG